MSNPKHRLGRRQFLVRAGGTGLAVGAAGAGVGSWLASAQAASAAFGYTDDGSYYTVTTGGGLVFKVHQTNGDLTSLVYNGVQYQGYSGQNSQVESGLGPRPSASRRARVPS